MALSESQWPCIECRIKEEQFRNYKAELEAHIYVYKRKLILSHTLIEKYNEKCCECENLYQQLEKCVGILANYKWRMGCALRTEFPMRTTLKETRDELMRVQSQLASDNEARNANQRHSVQLQNHILKLQEKTKQLEKELEESKGTVTNLQRKLKSANQARLNLKNKVDHLQRICKSVRGEGCNQKTVKDQCKKFKPDLDPYISEDEGISSLDRGSTCSSLDNWCKSMTDLCTEVENCHSPGMLSESCLDVDMKDNMRQSGSGTIDGSAIEKQITYMDVSCEQKDSTTERQKIKKQNATGQNEPLPLPSSWAIEGRKDKILEMECIEYKNVQTNKFSSTLNISVEQNCSPQSKYLLKNHIVQERSLPLLNLEETESGGSGIIEKNHILKMEAFKDENPETCKKASECSILEEKHHSTSTEGSLQNHIERDFTENVEREKKQSGQNETKETNCVDDKMQRDELPSLHSISANSMQNDSLSADIWNSYNRNSSRDQNETLSQIDISSPKCEKSLHFEPNNAESENQKQGILNEKKTTSIFDIVETEEENSLSLKLISFPMRPESAVDSLTPKHDSKKQSETLPSIEQEESHSLQGVSNVDESFIDNIIQEMTFQCHPLLSPLSATTLNQDEESACKRSTMSCNIAVGTETNLCDAEMQTTEEYTSRRDIEFSDGITQTENVICYKATQTDAKAQLSFNKKDRRSIAVQTELHDACALRTHNGTKVNVPDCSADKNKVVHETLERIVHEFGKMISSLRANMLLEPRELSHDVRSCKLDKEPPWSGHLLNDNGTKQNLEEGCYCNANSTYLTATLARQHEKFLDLHQQYVNIALADQYRKILNHCSVSDLAKLSSLMKYNTDYHSIEQHINTIEKQCNSVNVDKHLNTAAHHLQSEQCSVNRLGSNGGDLHCNKRLETLNCSNTFILNDNENTSHPATKCSNTFILNDNENTSHRATVVKLKHENSDETVEEAKGTNNTIGNDICDKQKHILLKQRKYDKSYLFGSLSDISSDDDRKACSFNVNKVSLRKRTVESDSDLSSKEDVSLEKKHRYKKICILSSEENSDSPTYNHKQKSHCTAKAETQLQSHSESSERSTIKPISGTMALKVTQAFKKRNKASKLERMRVNIIKAKTRTKIPRASPERMNKKQRQKKLVNAQVSDSPQDLKTVINQGNKYSLTSPSYSSCIKTDLPNTAQAIPECKDPCLPLSLPDCFPDCNNEGLLIGSQVRLRASTNTSVKLASESLAEKLFEVNATETSSYTPMSPLHIEPVRSIPVIIPLSPPKLKTNESSDSLDKKKLEQVEEHAPSKHGFIPHNNSISEKKDEKLPNGNVIRWAFEILQKEVKQEQNKRAIFTGSPKLHQRVANILKELESETFNDDSLSCVVLKLTAINKKAVEPVAWYMIKAVERDSSPTDKTYSPPAPVLPILQQRLIALIFVLYSHKMFKGLPEKILLAIEYRTLRLGRSPEMQVCRQLVCFHSAVCRAMKDVKRTQMFCLDALYSLQYKSSPILHAVLCTFPEALPHADKSKDIPLVKCFVFLIFNQVQQKRIAGFSIKPLKDLLHKVYGYVPGEFSADQLLSFLLDKLRNEGSQEVPIALILLGKRMPHEWSYKILLCKALIPLINDWKVAKLEHSICAKILPVIGYIVRCFPVGESRAFIENIKNIFTSIMEDKSAPVEVQEGALMGLISLSRHNPSHILNLLKCWEPKMKLSMKALQKIAAFMQYRPFNFWTQYVHNMLKKKPDNHRPTTEES